MPYQDLLQAAVRDPGSVDFTELRLAYVRSPDYDPYGYRSAPASSHGRVGLALRVGDLAGLLVTLSGLIELQYFDISAHQLVALAYERIGDRVTAATHRRIAEGLVASILQSGDGRSYQTAYQVISIAEEYAILDTLKLEVQAQSLGSHGGRHFDVFQVHPVAPGLWGFPGEVSPPREPGELYFNIDLFFGSPAHQQLIDALAGGQVRRVTRISIGAWILYGMPALLCLTSSLLLEASAARDLPALGTAGTALFLASLAAATVNFFLMLFYAGLRRRR
jgi:hypothetical protein